MNDLQHFGILGMHWGVRKASTSHPDHVTAVGLKKKKLHELSNAELKTLTSRLQLEKQFKDLSKQDVSAGKKFVTDLLMGALKNEVSSGLTTFSKALAPHVQSFIEKKIKKS